MNWQAAGMFWWLMPLGGAIVALYLLRMRRRDLVVPATFLWPDRVDEVRANSLFQRLKFNWLLVLQLLALLLIVAGLARLQTRQEGLAGRTTVAVIDASASMGATDVQPDRFGVAIDQVRGMIRALGANDRLALIEAGPVPRVVFPLGNDPARMEQALASLRRSDADPEMGEALRLASALVGGANDGAIVVLSDGVFAPVEDFSVGSAALTYRQIGRGAENVAVESLGTTATDDGVLAYVGVRAHGTPPTGSAVTLRADGQVVASVPLTFSSEGTWGRTFPVPAGAKTLEARVNRGGLLAADDAVSVPVETGGQVRVLLVTSGNLFLERVLGLDPRVVLDKSAQVPAAQRPGASGATVYDIVVFDGVKPEPVKARGVLTFGAVGAGSPVRSLGRMERPEALATLPNPVTDGVDLRGVYIGRAVQAEPVGGARVAIEARNGPLVVTQDGTSRQVWVAFRPLDSDFPLNFGFPIFMAQAIDFLAQAARSDLIAVAPGQVLAWPQGGADRMKITDPAGEVTEVTPRNERFILRNLDRVGSYRLEWGEEKRTVLVSLRGSRDSQVAPQAQLSVAGQSVAAQQRLSRFTDWWKPLVVLTLLILALEWWVFARRS